ncbi:MAG: DUF3052 domain-containing protein [Anaerolineae bacterium]|nr:DUF3052 domain-containing protein [Anaerolineae bacterium]
MAGYSNKPLAQKLGLKPGMRAYFQDAPPGYADLLGELPEGVEVVEHLDGWFDFIQVFCTQESALVRTFPRLKAALRPTGMLWLSWPKKAARMPTDLGENRIRQIGLESGLVDVKVIAVDERWSGLKFVIRLRDR